MNITYVDHYMVNHTRLFQNNCNCHLWT